ncbi:hypothetical protein [Ekhidna sp.]|uniref:hypothetical protein n=1 Tax=Ekhidna sp. TaxID=2608089 RepID=UPI003CCBD9E3
MRLIITIFCLVYGGSLLAQNDSTRTEKGEILTGEVVIEKDKRIVLPQADKIFLRSSLKDYNNKPLNVSFDIREPNFEWPDYKSDVPFQTTEETYPEAAFQNYVKLGYGNYNSPLLEAGLFHSIGKWDSQAKLYYESFKTGPVNADNSGNAEGGVALSSTYLQKSFTITPSLSFNQNRYKYYGNTNRVNAGFDSTDPERGTITDFMTDLNLGWEKRDIEITIRPHFSSTKQSISPSNEGNSENLFGTDAFLKYEIDEVFNAGLSINGYVANYKGGLTYNRSLLNINPWVSHEKDKLSLRAGFILSSNMVNEVSETKIYPKIKADYSISENWTVFGTIEGGVQWNSLTNLFTQNSFLDDSLAIINTENTFSIGGGLEGNPVKNMLLRTSLTHFSLNGLPFFVPSSGDSSKYVLAYDTETINLLQFKSSISYMPNATSNYGMSLELNSYNLSSLDRPWHKPAYILKAFTSHNISEKLIVSAFFTSMGGIRGPADVPFGYVKLPAFTDVGISAKYLLSPRSSVFIDVNNLLNNEYERYLGYPIRGLAFKIGGQYRF